AVLAAWRRLPRAPGIGVPVRKARGGRRGGKRDAARRRASAPGGGERGGGERDGPQRGAPQRDARGDRGAGRDAAGVASGQRPALAADFGRLVLAAAAA